MPHEEHSEEEEKDERKRGWLDGYSWYRGNSNTLIDSLRKMAISLSQSFNLKIEIQPDKDAVAHTDVKNQTVTIGTKGIYENGVDYYVGLLLHEIAHIRFSPIGTDPVLKPLVTFKNPHIAAQMFNMVEDRRIDEKMKEEYPGAPAFYHALYDQADEVIAESLRDRPLQIYHRIQDAVQAEIQMRGARDPNAVKQIENEVKEWLLFRVAGIATMIADSKIDADMTTGVDQCDSMAELVATIIIDCKDADKKVSDIVQDTLSILKIIDPLIPDKEYSDKKAQAEAEARGEGEGGMMGFGKGSHAGQHSHDVGKMKEKMSYGKPPSRREDPFKNNVRDQYTRADERSRTLAEAMKRKLVAVMRDNDHQRFEGNQTRGLLNKKVLNRTARDNYRVYQKRLEKKGKKYAVAIIEDCSGSMSPGERGGEMDTAHETVALLTRVFRGLGFPSSYSIFSNQAKTVLQPRDRYIAKQVNDRVETSNGSYYGGGTILANGINEALVQLKSVGHGRHKLLVVITDASLDSSDRNECARILRKEMRDGSFSPMLYFIGSRDSVLNDARYEAHINNVAQDLIPEAVRLMKKIIAPMQW